MFLAPVLLERKFITFQQYQEPPSAAQAAVRDERLKKKMFMHLLLALCALPAKDRVVRAAFSSRARTMSFASRLYLEQLIDIHEYYGVPVEGNTADSPKPPGYTPFKRSFGRVPTGSRKS